MAFVKSIAGQFPTLGSPNFAGPPSVTLAGGGNAGLNAQVTGVVVNATTTNVVFNTFPGPGFISRGWIRWKTTSVNAATTLTCKITGTDGVTTQQLVPVPTTTAAGTNIDWMFVFMSDLNLTSVTFAITAGVNTSTSDVEIAGNV